MDGFGTNTNYIIIINNVDLPERFSNRETDIDFLAKQTLGFSGADIANVCNESACQGEKIENRLVGKTFLMP